MKKTFYTIGIIAAIVASPFLASAISVSWNKITAGQIYPPSTTDKVAVGTTTPYANLTVWGSASGNAFEIANSASTTILSVSNTGFGTTTLAGLNIAGSATSTSNVGFNITNGCYAIGGNCLTQNSGTVTSVATNNGLTGGTITTSGTIGLNITGLSTNGLITWDGSNLVATGTPQLTVGNIISTTTNASSFAGAIKIATTTSWLNSALTVVGTTTVSGQINSLTSSTTAGTSLTGLLVDWSQGNTKRITLTGNATLVINATSSNPIDGGKYVLKLCQDGTGGRTVTFLTPGQLSWYNGTTTATTTASYATWIGMIYDGREQRYNVLASTTVPCTP